MLELNRLNVTRIATTTAALDQFIANRLPAGTIVLRMAPDEALFYPELSHPEEMLELDAYAIILQDTSFVGGWLSDDKAAILLEHHCEWEPPQERPAYAQGAVAEIPVKIWFEADKALFVVHYPYRHNFEERIS